MVDQNIGRPLRKLLSNRLFTTLVFKALWGSIWNFGVTRSQTDANGIGSGDVAPRSRAGCTRARARCRIAPWAPRRPPRPAAPPHVLAPRQRASRASLGARALTVACLVHTAPSPARATRRLPSGAPTARASRSPLAFPCGCESLWPPPIKVCLFPLARVHIALAKLSAATRHRRRPCRRNSGHESAPSELVVLPNYFPGEECRRPRRIPVGRATPVAEDPIARFDLFLGIFMRTRGIVVNIYFFPGI
jgi:hypothetical protein